MTNNATLPQDIPFTLECEQCDACMAIGDYEEASAAGWTEIEYVPDCPQANIVGLCPACSRAEQGR